MHHAEKPAQSAYTSGGFPSSAAVFWIWQTAAIVVVWLSIIEWPLPPVGDLDPSWQQALVEASLHQWKFGSDFIFTWGPWGHLFVRYFPPEALSTKIAFEIIGRLVFAIVLVRFVVPLDIGRRTLFLLTVAVFGPLFFDTILLITTLALLRVFQGPRLQWAIAAAVLLALAFLSLIKFSNTIFVIAAVLLSAAALILERRWADGARMAGGYIVAFCLLWIAAGQDLASLPAFITTSLELSRGYAAAMAVEEAWPVFLTAVVLLLVHSAWGVALAMRARQRYSVGALALILLASVFVAWKHGFTRADAHMMGFFIYSTLLTLSLGVLAPGAASRAWWPAIAVPIGLLGFWQVNPTLAPILPRVTWDRIEYNARMIIHIDRLRPGFEAGLAANRKAWDFPLTRTQAGTASIDVIGYQQGIAYLNGLHYTPRPVPQSYATYTPLLMELNREFFEGPRAPDYVLAGLFPIDGRHPAEDDALLLAELPRRYEQVLSERGHILLKRRAAQPPANSFSLTPLLDLSVRIGEEFDLPAGRDHALWLQLEAQPTMLGRMRALLYKPPPLGLTIISDSGSLASYRLIPDMARSGFVIQPLLRSPQDLEAFVSGRGESWARSVKIEAPLALRRYWGEIHVRISRINSIRLAPAWSGHTGDGTNTGQ